MPLVDDIPLPLPIKFPAYTQPGKVELRKAQAIELHKQGVSYKEIGKRIGLSTSRTYALVQETVREYMHRCTETTAHVISVEMMRLDAMVEALWDKVEAGNPKACDTVLRIQERRAKYLSLDAPAKIDIEQTGTQVHLYIPDNGRYNGPPQAGVIVDSQLPDPEPRAVAALAGRDDPGHGGSDDA